MPRNRNNQAQNSGIHGKKIPAKDRQPPPKAEGFDVSEGEVLAQQKYEMEMLEMKNAAKRREEEELRKKEMKETEERIKRLKIEEQEAQHLARNLPPEPAESEPNVTTIVFRLPDGATTKTRRFRFKDRIQLLYDFIASYGREIFEEEGDHHLSLLQPFPFKEFTDKSRTLEEEGLVPNVVLQVKEFE